MNGNANMLVADKKSSPVLCEGLERAGVLTFLDATKSRLVEQTLAYCEDRKIGSPVLATQVQGNIIDRRDMELTSYGKSTRR